jgi:hypothetical protein
MAIRDTLAARIPHLYLVTFVNDAELAANTNHGVLRRFITACDVAWGVWGGPEPCTTISSRTAKTLLDFQGGIVHAPLWALMLGATLEVIDPGHLQGAMIADVARQVAGMKYLTGQRTLKGKTP